MNRVDRLFGILLLLQANPQIRAEDIAQRYEVSRRTIYRDMAALSELGVPIMALPGEGYSLMEGFYLPPLIFTPEEAAALALGAQMLTAHAAEGMATDTQAALDKLRAALPPETCAAIDSLIESVGFGEEIDTFDLDDPVLILLQTAVHQAQPVTFRYQSYHSEEITTRTVEPHKLNYVDKAWYLEGFCRLRQDQRTFRVSRMLLLRREPAPASTPQPIISAITEDNLIEVVVRFRPDTVRKVHERQHFAFQWETHNPDDSVTMGYAVSTAREIMPWLLYWGAGAEVLSPESVRAEMRAEVEKLLKMLT